MKTLARFHPADSDGLYLDLENQRELFKLSDPKQSLSQRGRLFVVIDEVQGAPDLFPPLCTELNARKNQQDKGSHLREAPQANGSSSQMTLRR